MTLLDLLSTDGFTLKRQATTNGGEYAGACPWCGGRDRFRVWPEQKGGRSWCRGCGKGGDAIQFLREYRGLSFRDACDYIGREPGRRSSGARQASAWAPREAKSPADVWQNRARAFLDRVVACLWSDRGDEMRAWLHAGKGLSDATIKAARLGMNPADIYEPRDDWGLEAAFREGGQERRQWLPGGLVIPLVVGGDVHRLRIRRDEPGDGSRYVVVSGSDMKPMFFGQDKGAAIAVESEIDAILLHQEVGDLAEVIALGNAQAKPDRISHEALTALEIILVSLDSDDAGAKACWQFWPATYGKRAKRWPCVGGKDPSAARLGGLDLRSWVVAGIFGTEERFERFCIQTIDGALSDIEVLRAMGPDA